METWDVRECVCAMTEMILRTNQPPSTGLLGTADQKNIENNIIIQLNISIIWTNISCEALFDIFQVVFVF